MKSPVTGSTVIARLNSTFVVNSDATSAPFLAVSAGFNSLMDHGKLQMMILH